MRDADALLPYGGGVEAVIFGVLVVAWIAYLVPWFVMRRHDHSEDTEEVAEFPDSMSIVRDGGLTISSQIPEAEPDLEVATPYTRAHARHEVQAAWADAALRRRRTMAVLLGLTTVSAVLGVTSILSWWFAAGFGVLVVAFLVVSRFSVVAMSRRLDRRMELIDRGWDERTVAINLNDAFPGSDDAPKSEDEPTPPTEYSVELNRPVSKSDGSLWEAVPVTAPTYVSKPVAARTVRTIDLSAPGPVIGQTNDPVTAEHPQGEREESATVLGRAESA
ncbi:hypothetical protein JS278_02377 [Acidipropionibacterium virtanenii]|uniref:Uncharacterized protein n=1 Tax=Acidipropionibacterium virtanenii TaxID=2057246 RepID=A0A344UW69_9ACTN|nr:hypothetical protein JS278_02377 [Acidipropionibacterium virtanenii]